MKTDVAERGVGGSVTRKQYFLEVLLMVRTCQSCEVSDPREDGELCQDCQETFDWFQENFEVPDVEEMSL